MNNLPKILICILIFSYSAFGQEIIFLKNPSFEAVPKYATVPGGWRNCAFNGESPSDIHPVKDGIFQVNQTPQDGRSYIGLVARDNATKESVGQELLSPLKEGQCYEISLWMCRSEKLTAVHRRTRKMVDFNKPTILRIWGGLSPCGRKYILGESPVIDSTDWNKFIFRFQPSEEISWICFEVFFANGKNDSYNGHLLLDNISPIIPIDCSSSAPLADLSKATPPKYQYVKHSVPERVNLELLAFSQKEPRVIRDFRMVSKPEDINDLIDSNCGQLGFLTNSYLLVDEGAKGLMEITSNIRKFKNYQLVFGLLPTDQKLIKKRMKVLDRICHYTGLLKNRYEITTLPISANKNDWHCGKEDIWIKILKKENYN